MEVVKESVPKIVKEEKKVATELTIDNNSEKAAAPVASIVPCTEKPAKAVIKR